MDIGIVGLGKMGIAHMAILNALDGASIKAVAESQKIVRKAASSVLGSVPFYDDYRKMLASEKLDAVYITAPTSLHVIVATDCAERGLPFFVEKPLGITAAESEALVDATREGPLTMVGYCKHFVGTFAKAKEILDSGILGEQIYLTSSMYVSQMFSSGSGWRYKKSASGGGVLNILATHLVDVLLWLFGDIDYVSGTLKSHYSGEVEDFVHANLAFASGLTGFMDASWSVRGYRIPEMRIDVQCESGAMTVTDDYVKHTLDSDEKVRVLYKQDLFEGVEIYVGGEEYTREDSHFLRCLREGTPTGIDVKYGCEVQRVTDAVYRSAESGEPVRPGRVAP